MRFAWDSAKAASNLKKHGVMFAEAATVFEDLNALQIFDPEHSAEEDRFVILGMSNRLRILVVCHCYRENDEQIRIISARKANPQEVEQYIRRL